MAKISLKLVTWNVGCTSREKVYEAIHDHRDEHQIGFLQEIHVQEKTAKKKCEFPQDGKYYYSQCSTHPYHAAIYARKEIDGKSVAAPGVPPLTPKSIEEKCVPKATKEDSDALKLADRETGFDESLVVEDMASRRLMKSDILERFHAVRLTIEGMGNLIAVSFHNFYKTTAGERQSCIKLFFNLMCRLAQIEKCLVIIGGDFNLEIRKWKKNIEQAFFGKVYVANMYQPTPDRENAIDTFAVVYPGSIAVAPVICELTKPIPDTTKKGFDHGLVTVRCTLKPGFCRLASELQLSASEIKVIYVDMKNLHELFKRCQNSDTITKLWHNAHQAIKLTNKMSEFLDIMKTTRRECDKIIDSLHSILQCMHHLFEEQMRVTEHKCIDALSESEETEEVRSDMTFAHKIYMCCQRPQYKQCTSCASDHIKRLCCRLQRMKNHRLNEYYMEKIHRQLRKYVRDHKRHLMRRKKEIQEHIHKTDRLLHKCPKDYRERVHLLKNKYRDDIDLFLCKLAADQREHLRRRKKHYIKKLHRLRKCARDHEKYQRCLKRMKKERQEHVNATDDLLTILSYMKL